MDNSMFKLVSDWMKNENLGIASSKKAMSKNDKSPGYFRKYH